MSVIDPARIIGGTIYERDIPGVGLLRFEQCGPNEWLTLKGEPAKTTHRCYRIGDVELDSVSSIVGTLDKPALLRWYEEQTAIGTRRAANAGELDDTPDEDLVERLKLLNLGASAARDQGADRGHAIHAVFEAMARGEDPPDPETFPAMARPWLRGAMNAWLRMDPEVHIVEGAVVHPSLGYAGRFDLIATINGRRTLIDYKTGKGKVYDSAHYQTRLYAMALACSGIKPVEDIAIVGIDDDGGAQLVHCEATWRDALDLVMTFRSRKRINAGMAAQRKIAKRAAKVAA